MSLIRKLTLKLSSETPVDHLHSACLMLECLVVMYIRFYDSAVDKEFTCDHHLKLLNLLCYVDIILCYIDIVSNMCML